MIKFKLLINLKLVILSELLVEMRAVMIKIKKAKFIKRTKMLVGIIIICTVIFLLATISMIKVVLEGVENRQKERSYTDAVSELLNASEYLTYLSLNYVVTGEKEFYSDYIQEVQLYKTRENAIVNLLELGVKKEDEILFKTLELSYTLGEMESKAFAFVNSGYSDKAKEILFSLKYEETKQGIDSNISLLTDTVEKRIAKRSDSLIKKSYQIFVILFIMGISTVIASLFLLIIFLRAKEVADIDELTGLQNRNVYKEKIDKLIQDKPNKFGALIFCDIDNLKFINERYGHNNGDSYIQTVANSLRCFEKYESVLARPSGDEFIVYIHGFNNKEDVMKAVEAGITNSTNLYFITTLHIE